MDLMFFLPSGDASFMDEGHLPLCNHGETRGIDSFPDELLLEIVQQLIHDDTETGYSMLSLSLVNRRFRRIALSMPSFWTKIPGVQHDMYKTFFERSEDLPLEVTITIKEKYTDTEIQQLDESLSPDSTRRWKKVTFLCDCICLIMEQREHSDSFSQVLSKFRMLQLPSLETARFVLHGDEFHEYKRQLANELLRYHDGWEAPKLKTLKLEGFIPRFFSKRMDSATDVTVNIDYMDHEVEYEPFSLAYFLQSVSAVENLKIVLNRPISSEKLYNYLPITYRRISRRLGLTDLDDTSTLVISDHSIQKLVSEAPVPDVTPDSLYKHLLITYRDEDSGRVVDREDHDMELDNQAYASEEWIQRIYLPGESLINLSIYPFVHLAKLKYLEYDLDPLCDIYLIMSVNRMLEIPTVEELVFRLNKVRKREAYDGLRLRMESSLLRAP
ncbi:hypothetical protein PNOK_0403200 [Pyrrhoderma noxium]|uniref:F-box domain-containing protein n=1 Tax=Pyrrhoderma noxium TaxID=2282107 RepID=A0A286UPK7_9AGAM|nr:hypothetical protein PNOK_0403200 [Pyrrhoderma noxium]